jgi:hypothetical protein
MEMDGFVEIRGNSIYKDLGCKSVQAFADMGCIPETVSELAKLHTNKTVSQWTHI